MRHDPPLAPIALLLCLACVGCAAGRPRAVRSKPMIPCPLKHGRWEPLPAFWDEFEGTALDPTRWHPNNPNWKGRQPGFFHTSNVVVSDGQLHLTMKHEDLEGLPTGYHTYTSAAVKSTTKVRYGYFEIRCRPMDSKGSSAFWFYDDTPEIWTEIDVFEMGAGHPKHEHTVHMNVHVFHTHVNPDRHWAKPTRWEAPWRLADEAHVYALEWDPEAITFHVDGRAVRTLENTHWHQPLYLNFDSETMPEWFGLPEVATLPSTFSIDYVRAWKRVDASAQPTMEYCSFAFPDAEPEAVRGKTATYRLTTSEGGSLLVVAQFDAAARPTRVHLDYDHPAFFDAQEAEKIQKRIGVRDTNGNPVLFTLSWSKSKDEKRHNSYRADNVAFQPPKPPGQGAQQVCEFRAQNGKIVRMTLTY